MIRVRGNCPWKFQRQLQKGGRVQKEKKTVRDFAEGCVSMILKVGSRQDRI